MQHALSEWQIMVYIQYLYQMQSIICIFEIVLRKKKIKEENSSRERKRIQKEKHDLRERVSLLLCWAAKEKVHSAFSRYWKRLTAPDLISE